MIDFVIFLYHSPILFSLFPVLILTMMVLLSDFDKSSTSVSPDKDKSKKEDMFINSHLIMLDKQIKARGITDPLVLKAMARVKRHLFVPEYLRDMAYNDYPLPIGHGQTISQPYIVALMTELLELKGGERVLEIGTGSGYQAAVLAQIASEVYSVEIVQKLAQEVKNRLQALGYTNIKVKAGDGYKGWPEEAPFDGIILTAAPDHIPGSLIEQLKIGGIMVLPIGAYFQDLYRIRRSYEGIFQEKIAPVRFVPMTGGPDS